jgi:hypothetical protein
MFLKLNKTIDSGDFIKKQAIVSYADRLIYSKVDTSSSDFMFSMIPDRYQKFFGIVLMEINKYIPPHTDSNVKVTINAYIKTGNSVTSFYEVKNKKSQPFKIKNQTNGNMFVKEDLIKLDKFTANTNEIWMLDVTKIHEVIPPGPTTDRIAICLQTNTYKYDVVKEMLKETGFLDECQ